MDTSTHATSLETTHVPDAGPADVAAPLWNTDPATDRPETAVSPPRVTVPSPAQLVAMLGEVRDPVARAQWATRLLKELELARLAVAEVRRVAAGQTGLGPRGLERALGISVTAAADLLRATHGAPRRPER